VYHIPAEKKDLVDLKTIEYACQDALDLIGVIPVHSSKNREKRNCALKVTMGLPELLGNYFATKPELSTKRDSLIEKALILWQNHLDQQEEQM
jgi:hypothetical protein